MKVCVFSLILAISVTFTYSSSATPALVGVDQTALFAACLQQNGSPDSMLVSRDSSPEKYKKLNFQWNTRLGYIQPMAILLIRNATDVSNGVKCARELNIRIVPKSGGHSYEKYSFGDNSTIVIDLRRLDQIIVSEQSKTAEVGAGVLLARLYWEIWNHGKFGIPAGSCTTVGAGGLTLGGGYGFLSKRHGLTSDNVLEVEVVDAAGKIEMVDADSNPDMFWALLGGGGGNFGIVTKLKYKLFEAANVTFTHVYIHYYDVQRFSLVFKAWDTWNLDNLNTTAYGGLVIGPGFLTVNIFDAGMTAEDIERIREIFPAEDTIIKNLDFIELVVEGSHPAVKDPAELANVTRDDMYEYPFRAKSYFSSRTLTDDEIDQVGTVLARVPSRVLVQFSSYGGAINDIPIDATSFVHRNSLYNVQVPNDADPNDLAINEWVKELDQTLLQVLDNGEAYQNYNDGELGEEYLERYYGSNLQRLMAIKRKVDPDNIFHFPQSIPLTP